MNEATEATLLLSQATQKLRAERRKSYMAYFFGAMAFLQERKGITKVNMMAKVQGKSKSKQQEDCSGFFLLHFSVCSIKCTC